MAEQVSVFGGGAFAGPQIQQHLQIHPFSREVTVVVGDNQFDQQHRGLGAGCRANVTKDLQCLFVGPVVDDVLEDVGVTTGRNAVKK